MIDAGPARGIMSLPIGEIAVGSRIGFYDAEHAKHLGASIAADGQHDPIHVKRNGNAAKLKWTLVAGLHRMRGVESIGRTSIDAIQVAAPGASDAELQRLELSENLDHRQRRPIERAMFMVERARLEEGVDYPGRVGERSQVRAGRARQAIHSAAATVAAAGAAPLTVKGAATDADDTMSFAAEASITVRDAADWRKRTAIAMGCSVATLERYQRIHRAIVVELVDEAWRSDDARGPMLPQLLNFHPLGESMAAMTRLATLNPIARLQAANAILARPDCESMDEVMVAAGLAASTGNRIDPEKLGLVMMDAWAKMPLTGRRAHVDWLVENVTPGMAVDMVAGFKKRGLLP